MILIDLSQTIYSVIFQNAKEGLSESMVRSMTLVTLLSYKKQFGQKYGNPVVAVDSMTGYWRRDIFPHYKMNRKKEREKSKYDWEEIARIAKVLTEEFKQVLPWKVVQVPKAEADDVIAVLAQTFGDKPTLIVSSDKDYKQLHYKEGVAQYSPIMKKWIRTTDPKWELMELILSGDASDGIPNVRSDDDCCVTDKRQKPMTAKMKEEYHANPAKAYRDFKDRFTMNEQLIDLNRIPDEIRSQILEEYEKPVKGGIQTMFKYCIAKRLRRVQDDLELFRSDASGYQHVTDDPNEPVTDEPKESKDGNYMQSLFG